MCKNIDDNDDNANLLAVDNFVELAVCVNVIVNTGNMKAKYCQLNLIACWKQFIVIHYQDVSY